MPSIIIYTPLTAIYLFFFFTDTATTNIYTLSLHDALPIFLLAHIGCGRAEREGEPDAALGADAVRSLLPARVKGRSEEHTSELQSLRHLVCRLLLEKKKRKNITIKITFVGTRETGHNTYID